MGSPRRWAVSLGLLVLVGCGGGVTGPEGLPSFSGNYTLEVQASGSCAGLPVTRLSLDVVATTSREAPIQAVVVALPGGGDRLKMDFTFAQTLPANGSVFVFNACERDDDDLPIPGTAYSATLAGSLAGQVSRGASGRGEVLGREPQRRGRDPRARPVLSGRGADVPCGGSPLDVAVEVGARKWWTEERA